VSRFGPGDLVSGKYRIVRLIGDGGMGVVYEARHEVLGSGVALKFLHADLAKRPGLTQRFLQEARVSATIQSSHVCHVTDVDTAQDGSPYLVMELLAGQALQSMLDRQGKLPVEQAVDFALQILAGLEAAHATGVVHRDLKPDNVFVTPSGGGPLLKLIDFGIAKLRASSEFTKGLTRAGVVMGTPEYMAPEQLVSAQTTDHRADIYSLGVILFEMLAGCRPADGDDAEIIVASVQAGRVRNLRELVPGLAEGLVALIERATKPFREQRFESASEMRLALARFAGHLSHAGRLAATAEPLAPLPTPASAALLSVTAARTQCQRTEDLAARRPAAERESARSSAHQHLRSRAGDVPGVARAHHRHRDGRRCLSVRPATSLRPATGLRLTTTARVRWLATATCPEASQATFGSLDFRARLGRVGRRRRGGLRRLPGSRSARGRASAARRRCDTDGRANHRNPESRRAAQCEHPGHQWQPDAPDRSAPHGHEAAERWERHRSGAATGPVRRHH
jgi:serine/threonine protein kinase